MAADRKISQHTAILGSALADGDLFEVVDVSDTTDAATGTNMQMLATEAAAGLWSRAGKAGAVLVVDAVNGNDATGARGYLSRPFLTLATALTAASSGDTITVYPGAYTCTASLAKAGVNWHFYPGATVTFTADSAVGIWDDGGSAMTFVVTGAGKFIRLFSNGVFGTSVVACSHAASDITIDCLDVTLGAPGSSNTGQAVLSAGGTLLVRCRDITAFGDEQSGVWWTNGQCDVVARSIAGNSAGVYSAVTSTPTGDCNVTAHEVVGLGVGRYGVWETGSDTTAALWVSALTVRSLGSSVAAVGANRVYVKAQKYFGGVVNHGSGLLYVRGDKVVASGDTPSLYDGTGSTGTTRISIAQWDATDVFDYAIVCDTGTQVFDGGELAGGSVNANGVSVLSGGTTRFRNFRIDTTASTAGNPVTKSGGTLVLDAGCVLVAEAGRDSIAAGTAQAVKSYGAWANKAANGNVTVTGTLNVDSGVS